MGMVKADVRLEMSKMIKKQKARAGCSTDANETYVQKKKSCLEELKTMRLENKFLRELQGLHCKLAEITRLRELDQANIKELQTQLERKVSGEAVDQATKMVLQTQLDIVLVENAKLQSLLKEAAQHGARPRHVNPHKVTCEICNKQFARKQILREHILLHANPSAFACKICLTNFSSKGTLKRHSVRAKH